MNKPVCQYCGSDKQITITVSSSSQDRVGETICGTCIFSRGNDAALRLADTHYSDGTKKPSTVPSL